MASILEGVRTAPDPTLPRSGDDDAFAALDAAWAAEHERDAAWMTRPTFRAHAPAGRRRRDDGTIGPRFAELVVYGPWE